MHLLKFQLSVVQLVQKQESLAEYGMVATDHITSEPESQSFYNDAYDGLKIVLEDNI